jgi:FMN phosphatase YigB (HAD superfamily)
MPSKISFPLLQNEFPELFTYQGKDIFDGIMISGKIGKVKPQNHAFQTFLQKFNINPEQAIFIDDTLENIQAAENLNITSIYCRYNNVHSIVTELVNKLN